MVTMEDAKAYLRIDYSDNMTDANVDRALKSARARMLGAVGSDVETYLPDDPRIDQLVLVYTRENYDEGELTEKEIRALKHIREDLEPQLRLELRQKKEEAGVVTSGV